MFNDSFTSPMFHTFGKWNGYTLFEHEGDSEQWLQHIFSEYYEEICKKYKRLAYSEYMEDYNNDISGLLYKWIESELIHLPIHVYEHGGITMNTGGFSCQWDSGQAGYIYMSKDEARKMYNVKRVNVAKIEQYMRDHVAYLAAICEGSIYGYDVSKDGESVASCWGFVETEYDIEKTQVLQEARKEAEYAAERARKEHIEKHKAYIKNNVPLYARV